MNKGALPESMIRFYKTNTYWNLVFKRPNKHFALDGTPKRKQGDDIPHGAAMWCGPFTDALYAGYDVFVPWEIRLVWHGGNDWEVAGFYNYQQYAESYFMKRLTVKLINNQSFSAPPILETSTPTESNFTLYTGMSIKTVPGYGFLWLPPMTFQSSSVTLDCGFIQGDKVTYQYWLNFRALRQDSPIILSPQRPVARLLVIRTHDMLRDPNATLDDIVSSPSTAQELYNYLYNKYIAKGTKDSGIYKRSVAK